MKRNASVKKKPEKLKYANGTYTVVKFIENSSKLFACLPDLWMVNEEKTACFWPPKSGKSATLRAMNQDEPDDDWEVYECEVVSEGHATYSIGSNIVREKASQPYNTSSADEHVQAAKFRRKHPGLIDTIENAFENMFAAADANKIQKTKNNPNKQVNSNVETESGEITSFDKTCQDGKNKENDLPASSLIGECNISIGSRASIQSSSIVPQSQKNKQNDLPASDECNISSGSRASVQTSSIIPQSQTSGLNHSSKPTQSPGSTKSHNDRSESPDNHSQLSSKQSGNRHSQPRNRSRSRNRSSSGSRNRLYTGLSRRTEPRSGKKNGSASDNRVKSRHPRSRPRIRSRSISHSKSSIRSISSRSYHSVSKNHSPSRISIDSRSISNSSIHLISNGSHYDSVNKNHSSSRPRQDSRSISRDISRSGSKRNSYCSVSSLRSSNHSRSKSGFRSNVSSRSRRRSRSRSILRSGSSRSSFERSTRTGSYRERNTLSKRSSNIDRNAESISSGRAIENQHVPQSTIQLNALIDDVNKLTNVLNKNNRRFIENDRRLTRMEVTVNKTFVMLGDLTNAFNVRMSLVGNSLPREVKLPRGFHMPNLPIESLEELTIINRDFKDKEFLTILINHEKEYCTPSSATDTATLTGYLKRFISVSVRASLVLKDNKGQIGLTLYRDFQRVYLFIIDVMKSGYLIKNKVLTNKDIHGFLRVVWGRSKQMLGEANKTTRRRKNKSRSRSNDSRRPSEIGISRKRPNIRYSGRRGEANKSSRRRENKFRSRSNDSRRRPEIGNLRKRPKISKSGRR